MDYFDADTRARMLGNQRSNEIQNYNIQAEILNRQAATDIARIKQDGANNLKDERDSDLQKEVQDSVTNALGIRGSIKDLFKENVIEGVKGKAEQVLAEVGEVSNEVPKVPTAMEVAEVGNVAEGEKGVLARAMESDAAKGIGGKLGAIGNITLAADAIRKDYSHGKFQVAGNNWEEQGANEIQIGAGIADTLGIAIKPLAAVGALLGIAAGTLDTLGRRREGEEAEEKTKADVKSKITALKKKERFVPKLAAKAQSSIITARPRG